MILHLLNADRTTLYRDNPDLDDPTINRLYGMVKRRLKREPLQYIFGETDFYGMKIEIGPGVLIPRPETEIVVEKAIEEARGLKKDEPMMILDLCCGSGCIALSLAGRFPDASIYGVDLSAATLKYAARNAIINGMKNVSFVQGDLFEPVRDRKFHLIISNPPYIRSRDIESLQPEIALYEPPEALDGGEDGVKYYKIILSQAKDYLYKKGILVLETGDGQSTLIESMAKASGFSDMEFIKDYSGIYRVAIIRNR